MVKVTWSRTRADLLILVIRRSVGNKTIPVKLSIVPLFPRRNPSSRDSTYQTAISTLSIALSILSPLTSHPFP